MSYQKFGKIILSISVWLYTNVAYAVLPTAHTSENAENGNYIALGTEVTSDGMALVIKIIGVVLLGGSAWAMISSFMAVQNKKETWTDFGKTALGGLFVCVIGIILLTQANEIFA